MKRTFFAALLLLFPLCLGAQQSEDYKMYAANNGASMLLLRGRQGMEFPLPHNGTHFWYTPQFRSGTLYYNSKLYENVLLNIDAFNQELLVRDPNGITNILLSRNYVKWFEIEGRKFVNLQAMGYEDAPQGYFQLMYDGKSKLFFRIDKALERDVDGRLWESAGYQGNLKPGVFDIFVERKSYYVMTGDSDALIKIKNKNALLKVFKKYSKDIRKHLSSIDRYGSMSFETLAVEVLEYMEEK